MSDNQGETALPSSARLLEVINLEDPSPAAISARWSSSGRSTRAVVGYSLDGPFALDLVQHGPHGLVAGTTGSGKSEFLQTVVASLAVANRPDAMNFVLVSSTRSSAPCAGPTASTCRPRTNCSTRWTPTPRPALKGSVRDVPPAQTEPAGGARRRPDRGRPARRRVVLFMRNSAGAAEPLKGSRVSDADLRALTTAAGSCPMLTPARLAGQI